MATAVGDSNLSIQESLSRIHSQQNHHQNQQHQFPIFPTSFTPPYHPERAPNLFGFVAPSNSNPTSSNLSTNRPNYPSTFNLQVGQEIQVNVKEEPKERENSKLQRENIEVVDHNSDLVSLGNRRKETKKSKVSRHVKAENEEPQADHADLNMSGTCRYDSSLGLLTKKFVSLMMEAKDGILDLNWTAQVLKVQKRRIYDITNVLEGIGLIEKTLKNHVQWKGSHTMQPTKLDYFAAEIQAEIELLRIEEIRLEQCIRETEERLRALRNDEYCQKYLFLTEKEILGLPCFKDETLIAIKAPHATSIEVPDPEQDLIYPDKKDFRLIVRSHTGPIGVYLLSDSKGQSEDLTMTDERGNVDGDTSTSLDKERCSNTSNSNESQVCGIQQVIPKENDIKDDYWFNSDESIPASDLWGLNIP